MDTHAVALTGGIGTGKTLTAQVFLHLGVPVYNADKEAKRLYGNEDVIGDIVRMFGQGVVTNGRIDTKRLADVVFNDRQRLKTLSDYIHPKVSENFKQWLSQCNTVYAVLESAIVFESGWESMFERIICVSTPKELVLQRTMLRDGQSLAEVEKRINSQTDTQYKILRSDYVINNDNVQTVIPQVLEIHRQLLQEFNGKGI
ncbi:MAG: dephospho-CoA kinase [Bacteroidales bacterium]|nr:dephospho-CoA kinase [Bacteroidales bacterium]